MSTKQNNTIEVEQKSTLGILAMDALCSVPNLAGPNYDISDVKFRVSLYANNFSISLWDMSTNVSTHSNPELFSKMLTEYNRVSQ